MLLDGDEVPRLHPRDIYRKMGLVFQNPDDQLFAHTVSEDVAFGPRNMGCGENEVRERVADALLAVEMSEFGGKGIHHLSYGQKKRVCIAGLLAMGHEILLLDEPTAGLDPMGEYRMMELLTRLNRENGVTIVMATHSVDLVPIFLHRLHILSRGKLVRGGGAGGGLHGARGDGQCKAEAAAHRRVDPPAQARRPAPIRPDTADHRRGAAGDLGDAAGALISIAVR